MNDEAQKLIDSEVSKLRKMTYDELADMVRRGESIEQVVRGNTGEEYQVSIRIWYDDKETKVVRVSGAIYRTSKRGFLHRLGIDRSAASQAFLMSRDGKFLGE